MKNLSKLFSLILAIAMVASLLTTASASTAGADAYADEPILIDVITGEPPVEELAEPIAAEPPLEYTATALKLEALMKQKGAGFQVWWKLYILTELNDISSIWETCPVMVTPTGVPTASLVSENTRRVLQLWTRANAYKALTHIRRLPECQDNEALDNQVYYHLVALSYTKYDLLVSLRFLGCDIGTYVDAEFYTPAEVITMAEDFLQEHPELEVLGEAYDFAKAGGTSDILATFQKADPEYIEDLWQRVAEATASIWPDEIHALEDAYAEQPVSYEAPEPLKPVPMPLPTSATGN